jgi:predicted DNA-binding ribbon-helix-helix protein
VRRTQLYLEDQEWERLHILARQRGTTLSELVREAIRDKYSRSAAARTNALFNAAGLWKQRSDLTGTQAYVRALRKDRRLERIVE